MKTTTQLPNEAAPDAASGQTVQIAVAGAVVGIVVVIILIVMVILTVVLWRKNRKSVAIKANGRMQNNEYPLTNPIYRGKIDSCL